jgi:hypothetical protein
MFVENTEEKRGFSPKRRGVYQHPTLAGAAE